MTRIFCGIDDENYSIFGMPILLAALGCLQWMILRPLGVHLPQPWEILFPGLAIVSAAFLLTWAAEAAEMDIPQNIAIFIVAFIAVLPEYAVDMYFAWMAGKDPTYISYATANMTGANRLLIGVGWPCVLLACYWKLGMKEIRLQERSILEVIVLFVATLYSFIIPIKATISLLDSVVLVGMFASYAAIASRADVEEPELEGPALLIGGLSDRKRKLAVSGLLIFSAATIFVAAEPFAEGLLAAGRHWNIEEFILVQWLAPLASEAPEFIVAVIMALKGRPAVGLRMLVSSKVNQWTLLVATLPATYSLSGGILQSIPLDARQVEEILLTSAQSLLGMVILLNLSFSIGEGLLLLGLFSVQAFLPGVAARMSMAAVYLVLAGGLFLFQAQRRESILKLLTRQLTRGGD